MKDEQTQQTDAAAKYIATRDIKLGSIDGDKIIHAGDEIDAAQIDQFPKSAYRKIDKSTFPDGKCPTCGTVIGTALGAPGVLPVPAEHPPSTQRDAPKGDEAVAAARRSMMERPDNADSGMPSWGKLPIDVENTLRSGALPAKQSGTTAATPSASGKSLDEQTDADRKRGAGAAPKLDADAPTMGGFGGDAGAGKGKGGAAKP